MYPRYGTREMRQPAVVVGEREVEEQHVVGGAVVGQLALHRDHRVVVAMADHAALRRAGRPRGVDEREDVLLVDRGDRLVELGGMRLPVGTSLVLERCEICVRQDLAQVWQLVTAEFDLGALRLVLADHAHRLGVREDVADVRRGAVRVDADRDRTDMREREVDERPFERRPGEDGERVALAHPA